METIGRFTFVPLDGDPPAYLGLDTLPSASEIAAVIRAAFAPFLADESDFVELQAMSAAEPPLAGLHIIYAYGHAWIEQGVLETASRSDAASVIEPGPALVQRLCGPAAERTILILDCCHAAAFDPIVAACVHPPRLVVFAAAVDEKAIALHGDRASRLSLAMSNALADRKSPVDFVGAIAEAGAALRGDGILPGQSVGYRMNGPAIRLLRGGISPQVKRERTVAIVRNILLGSGGAIALLLVGIGWYYWSHTLVEIAVGDLVAITNDVKIVGTHEQPAINASTLFVTRAVTASHVRVWTPSDNVILRIEATYRDGRQRALNHHLNLSKGFDPIKKFIALAVPSSAEVAAHPDMAYVPATAWFHGREREPRNSSKPFWIDLRPPTADSYLPVAEALEKAGRLRLENSYLLNSRRRRASVDAAGVSQLRQLSKDLGAIFEKIEASSAPHVSAPGDIVVGLTNPPCAACPAPMTRREAELYCQAHAKRLPTDLEWELAVRGVDGRDYPWGNQLDASKANVPGLPKQADTPPALKPVDDYRDFPSPFGLIDTVGNAGDWVVNESGSYERVYMGATYQFNPEDATVFRMLPVTDQDYLVREITVRCASEATSM